MGHGGQPREPSGANVADSAQEGRCRSSRFIPVNEWPRPCGSVHVHSKEMVSMKGFLVITYVLIQYSYTKTHFEGLPVHENTDASARTPSARNGRRRHRQTLIGAGSLREGPAAPTLPRDTRGPPPRAEAFPSVFLWVQEKLRRGISSECDRGTFGPPRHLRDLSAQVLKILPVRQSHPVSKNIEKCYQNRSLY